VTAIVSIPNECACRTDTGGEEGELVVAMVDRDGREELNVLHNAWRWRRTRRAGNTNTSSASNEHIS